MSEKDKTAPALKNICAIPAISAILEAETQRVVVFNCLNKGSFNRDST